MVFIDEIDALSPERNSSTQTHNEMAMVNTLLEEVSEVNEGDEDIIVVAATNRENQIDEAMLRSGRLSKKIEVPPPDEDTRRQIFDYHLDAPRAVDLELDPVGKQTVGLTAADMEQVATNAARNALKREGRVTLEDVQTAIDGVTSGKRSVSTFVSTPPDLDFSEVAGMENLKTKLSEKIIDPIQNPEENEKYGLSVSNGFLLHGPAGTGKTYISKALAGELGINFANITVTDLLSKWAGEGPDNIDTVFKEARQYAPCLVFIDEIDALIPKRGNRSQTQSQTNMVNTFLEELTTIEEEDHDVVVIGATNRIEQIDDAMLRSGRLSSKIHVPAPDPTARCDILDYHLNAPRADDLTLASIKDATEGLTAADMKEVANRAARSAKKHEREVTNEDLKDAVHSISATSSNVTRLNEHSEEKTNSLQDQHSEPQY
jgi:SpoVK/Ycf46/Vps4 family AAA+-type ATPase